jgi:nucleotide-binding universal stress UspA family protein
MTTTTILSVLGPNQGDRDLKLAAQVCESAGGHLSILAVGIASPVPIGTYADVMSDAWYVERQREAKKLNERVEVLEGFLAKSGLSGDVCGEYVELALAGEVIGRRARHADLTLLGPSLLADDAISDNALDGALFRSGKPALVVPETGTASLAPKSVVIAWDGSMEAARAVHMARSMLQSADAVRIVLVDPVAGEGGVGVEPGADMATYLARLGIKVSVERLPSSGKPIADVLVQHAGDTAADMIVMGAYGHSRLRERIFGGVTRSMLNNVKVPLFVSH